MSNKSAQTIRRLLKLKKIRFKRNSTPQGFHYFIDRDSLLVYLGMTPKLEYTTTSLPPEIKPTDQEEDLEIEEDAHLYRTDYAGHEQAPRDSFVADSIHSKQIGLVGRVQEGIAARPVEKVAPIYPPTRQAQPVLPPSEIIQSASLSSSETDGGQNQPMQSNNQESSTQQLSYSTQDLYNQFNSTVLKLIEQHESIIRTYEQDKRNLFQLAEKFQDRIINLEHYIKQLEAPKKRPWYRFW